VRVHNIVVDELERGAFDLVHTRNMLFHLTERQTALGRMVSALKPGGVLTPDAEFWRLSYTQIRDRILGTGQLSPGECDAFIALFDDPDFIWMGAVLMAVSGRRPLA